MHRKRSLHPKNIQTKDERTKLVFAVKIRIPNPDGELKAGMPADAKIILNEKSGRKIMNIIRTKDLKKDYGEIQAVKGINLEIRKGEMFGLVGPDGAGKTTTIRMLCGLITPLSGEAELFGLPVQKQKKKIQEKIGYLSQKFSLYGDLTVDENIEFFADIHNVKEYKKRRDELLDFTRAETLQRQAGRKAFRWYEAETRPGMFTNSPARDIVS